MKIKSRKRFFVRVLVGFTLLFIFLWGCRAIFGDPEYITLKNYLSPDGKYTAEFSSAAWGGWGYTYCLEKVAVRQNGNGLPLQSSSEIYKGGCYGRKPTDDAFVKWVDSQSLQITIYVERLEGDGYHFSRGAMPDGLQAKLKLKLE